MPYIGQNCPELKIKDCNSSGKRCHLRSSPMTLCQEIAFTEWFLKTEMEYYSKGVATPRPAPKVTLKSNCLVQHQQQQQQQQPIRKEDVKSNSKEVSTCAVWSERRHRSGTSLMRSKPLATTSSRGQRQIKKCYERWQEKNFDMGPVAEWWSLSNISTCSQLDTRMDQIFRLHRALSISATTHRHGKENDMSIWFICEVLTRTSKRDHYGSDLGIRKQKALSQVFKTRKDKEFPTFQWILDLVRTTNMILQYKNTWNC